MVRAIVWTAVALWLGGEIAPAQGSRRPPGAAELKHRIEKLRTVGRVLMIAAHPDDENTAFLAYCAQGRKLTTAYLSLTRGEGGQNLIGSEQGALLGVIRTQELLAARRVDGAEQFFTRAIDFGFSKTAEETLQKWGKEEVLGDVVSVIRAFRPDVIVLRFSGTSRDGHGHHQASALVGQEASRAAADAARFPERGKPWQARRLLWNGFTFSRAQEAELEKAPGRLRVDLGGFDPLLGYSYGELAGLSRSQHRSQGMGSVERRGSVANYLIHVDGEAAQEDWLEGVDISWRRVPGGAEVEQALAKADKAFEIDHPQKVIPALFEARKHMLRLDHPDVPGKIRETDEAIAIAAGLWLDVSANVAETTIGRGVRLRMTALSRLAEGLTVESVTVEGLGTAVSMLHEPAPLEKNNPISRVATIAVPANAPYTQPFWVRKPVKGLLYDQDEVGPAEAPPVLSAGFVLKKDGERIEVTRPVEHRYVDRIRGEMTRPFAVLPPVSLRLSNAALVFPDARPRKVPVEVQALQGAFRGEVMLWAPGGWTVDPPSVPFELKEAGHQAAVKFTVTPGPMLGRGELRAAVVVDGTAMASTEVVRIEYEHIPPQTVLPGSRAAVIREDIRITARKVGYVMGAGDEVPAALRQLGCDVALLDAAELARGDLSRFDAIVTGVRAWNMREDLRAAHERLWEYARGGGTVVVQYNIQDGVFFGSEAGTLKNIGPYPLKIGRARVSVEEAPVRVLQPGHALLTTPNAIASEDFDGWVQERGLYFPSEWDERYEALLEMADPGEEPLRGALLAARVGKGMYVMTTLAFFRQLPAGVPGAYRLFANLVSGGKPE